MGCPRSLGEALDGCGGWLGLISILFGIVAALTVAIGLAIDEITYREISSELIETSVKCGWSTATWCDEPFQMNNFIAADIDVDCVDNNVNDCCTFSMADVCDESTGFICPNDSCLHCDNFNAGTVFLYSSLAALALIGMATCSICADGSRQHSWGCFLVAAVPLLVALIAYPAMLGSTETEGNGLNESGCGDSSFCCYYTDCDDDDENCPTPPGQTYLAMIVALILCCVLSCMMCVVKRKYY